MITQDELKSVLCYDKDSGVFTWIKSYRNQHTGKVAGGFDKDGYVTIKIARKPYRAHNLAWLYMFGRMPDVILDHIDMVKDNNRINNLREVTHAENAQHKTKALSTNKSCGMLGVSLHKRCNMYRARIMTNGKRVLLGYFNCPQEAHEAYVAAKRVLHRTCEI